MAAPTPLRNATRIYVCTNCGLEVRGKAQPDGRILTTNVPPADDTPLPCLCWRCLEVPE